MNNVKKIEKEIYNHKKVLGKLNGEVGGTMNFMHT